MNKKIVAVAIVAILVVAAAISAIVVLNDKEKDYEYDPSKGWYSWDPTVAEVRSAAFSISPLLPDEVKGMYEEIYGGTVDYAKYDISDVPSDFLSYDSLVVKSTDSEVTVNSTIRDKSQSSEKVVVPVTLKKNPDNLLTTAGYAAVLYTLYKLKFNDDAAAETELWKHVFALDKSAFPNGSAVRGHSTGRNHFCGIHVLSDQESGIVCRLCGQGNTERGDLPYDGRRIIG